MAREHELEDYLSETGDGWNDSIERWTYATRTDLAKKVGVEGYYIRMAPKSGDGAPVIQGKIEMKNVSEKTFVPAASIVSIDALALVRFGLRAADDSRMLNTVRVIDSLLKVETTNGPSWRRYNHDGYGEHADGSAFDATGIGRPWPLLTGERAHYELAARLAPAARRLIRARELSLTWGGVSPGRSWVTPHLP